MIAWLLHHGDCIAYLRTLATASIDAVVTDPPYEIGFMGRAWDSSGIAYSAELWREIFRVLKPGGHVVSFSHERTYHRLACAIEDVGFEIRGQLLWIYGTGFPKSPRDITAAMDRARDDDPRPVCNWLRGAAREAGVTSTAIDAAMGTNGMAGHWLASSKNCQPACPSIEQFAFICATIQTNPPEEITDLVFTLNARKSTAGEAWHARPIVGEFESAPHAAKWRHGYGGALEPVDLSAGPARGQTVSELAAAWVGWATALRPSHEPIVLARKPMGQPCWRNVLQYGTGALNIDGCRLPMSAEDAAAINSMGGFGAADYVAEPGVALEGRVDGSLSNRKVAAGAHPAGRWPPNVLLSEVAAADLGPQARYFYCDKASTAEREAGLHGGTGVWSDGRAKAADYPSQRGESRRKNQHPTVKPLAVMRWLVRLVTPPGGKVLDPFGGSGTTGVAAHCEGFESVMIELEADHCELINQRMAAAEAGVFTLDSSGKTTVNPAAAMQGRLF